MKSATWCGILALVLGSVLAFFGSVRAEDMPAPPKADPPKTAGAKDGAKPDFSKFANPQPGKCLISGEDLDDASITAEYKGKTYVFCCPICKKKFVANPEKYASAAEPKK